MDYKGEFQTIDTEAKAYFLGFLYADGCLCDKNIYEKHIRLSLTDKQIIDDLYIHFPFFNKEIFDFSKYNKNCQVQYRLRKTCKEMFKDLKTHGLIERKSYENKIYLHIPKIDESLIRHFLRGYFDGDGSINISKNRPNGRRIEFCSVSEELIKEVHAHLKSKNIEFYKIRTKKNSDQLLYTMEATKTEIVLRFYEYLYKDATIYLVRKWEKFQNYKLIDKKERHPDCILCGAVGKVLISSKRPNSKYMMQRYRCTSCNKGFSVPIAQIKSDELLENQEIDNQQPS